MDVDWQADLDHWLAPFVAAPRHASSLGKTANCQSLVSVTLAPRLFLPESWTDDPERMARACVLKDRQVALTKPEIAIEEIDRVIASGAHFGCVLADSGCGSSGPFRRTLLWPVGLSRSQNVYPTDVCRVHEPPGLLAQRRQLTRQAFLRGDNQSR